MSVPLSDTRLTPLCGSSHWSLPVRCAMPTGHGPDYHAGWTGKPGTPGRVYVRYWAETGVTEQLNAGVWQPTRIPGPRCEELLAEVDRLRIESEQRLGELLFWEFEYREAMDNYWGEAKHAMKLSAELAELKKTRRNGVGPEELQDVAHAYRTAVATGVPPTKHVAEQFGASHSTAARWVGKARAAGLLGATSPGRKGEDDAHPRGSAAPTT